MDYRPDSEPGAQLQRELDATLVDILYEPDHPESLQDSGGRDNDAAIELDVQEFPDGGLDIDVDDSDHTVDDIDISQDQALAMCNSDRAKLQDIVDDLDQEMDSLRRDHQQEMQIAQIDLEDAQEQIQERDDRLQVLEEQLRDPTSRIDHRNDDEVDVDIDEDGQRLIDMNDMYAEEVQRLTEQVVVSGDRILDLEQQIEDLLNQTSDRRRSLHSNTDMEDDHGAAAHQDEEDENFAEGQGSAHEAEHEDPDQDIPGLHQQLNRLRAYNLQRDSFLKRKEARLDALWDSLRNLKDTQVTQQETSVLQARVDFLTTVMRRARDHINGETDVEHAGEIYSNSAEITRLTEELASKRDKCRETALVIDGLEREVSRLKLENASKGEIQNGVELENDMAVMAARINTLNQKVADAYNQYFAVRAENIELRRTNRACEERVSNESQELVDARQMISSLEQTIELVRAQSGGLHLDADFELEQLQSNNQLLQETIDGMVATQEREVQDHTEEVAMLRSELANAREENSQLEHGISLRDLFAESQSMDAGTPVDPDPLPQAKRRRRSPSEIDTDYDVSGDQENEIDSLITPSSFIESEPSPLLPRLRRVGKTRRQSQRLSVSQEPEDDKLEAQFQEQLTAAAPADPRGGVVVINRSEVPRVWMTAGKSGSSKRKRYM